MPLADPLSALHTVILKSVGYAGSELGQYGEFAHAIPDFVSLCVHVCLGDALHTY